MLPLSSTIIAEKNATASDGVWLILLEIVFAASTIRVVRNTEDIVWDGHTWGAFPFELDEISDKSVAEVPQVVVRVGNASRAMVPYLEGTAGGVGAEVTIRVVHSKHLDLAAVAEFIFMVNSVKVDSQWVTFTLGAHNPFRRRFPQHRFIKNYCRWRFKSAECGYTGSLSTCGKTLTECRSRNNSRRFGGFPSVGRGAVYA